METTRVYAKIDTGAIAHNIKLIKNKIGKSRLMIVVKADAYGHGAAEISHRFESDVDCFAVAETGEAMELRARGIKKPILILGYTSPALYETAIENDLTLTLFSLSCARLLSEKAVQMGKNARVHFAVDTGMGRIGWQVCEHDAEEAASAAKLPGIEPEGIFSHFATADESDTSFAEAQCEEFMRFCTMLEARGVHIPLRHMNNSAGILRFTRQYGMVRAGILAYGLYPAENLASEIGQSFPLRPAMELITHIAHIKELPAGRTVSYGATYTTSRKTLVATLPVGYADGYPRALSGKGEVILHGVRCPIIGRVCMDQMMVDITAVPHAKTEDEVTLVGRNGGEFISVEEIAALAGTINYEFICGIAKRVPRVYVK
ncbi:MAG: alanine racemase [Clostridia bacterium]|nr:alanine racemase [Clostridia bacterium]